MGKILGLPLVVALSLPGVLSGQLAVDLRADPGFSPTSDCQMTIVRHLLVGPDMSVFVPDLAAAEIYRFSESGQTCSRVVRRGKGPGEAVSISAVGLLGDSIWLIDGTLQRITLFPPSLEPPYTQWTSDRCPGRAWALLPDGRCVMTVVPTEPVPSAYHVVAAGAHWTRADTLATVSVRNLSMRFESPSAGLALNQPFADGPIVAVAQTGTVVAVVERQASSSSRSSFRVRTWTPSGGWLADTSFSYRARALTSGVVDSTIDAMMHQVKRRGMATPVTADSLRARLYRPRYLPPVLDVRVTPDSLVWIKTQGDIASSPTLTGGLWLVLDLRARVRQWVRAPQDLLIVAFDGPWLWGVRLSPDDEPQIARYRVPPP